MSNSDAPPAGQPPVDPEPTPKGKEIAELRMLSGLSWDDLARLFGVSRKRMQFWASDEPLNAANAALVMQVLEVARHADRGTATGTRFALHDASKGKSPFDLLVERRFDDARKALGPAWKIRRPKLGKLDKKIRDEQRPLPPAVLVGARQDTVHEELGPTGIIRRVRTRRRATPEGANNQGIGKTLSE